MNLCTQNVKMNISIYELHRFRSRRLSEHRKVFLYILLCIGLFLQACEQNVVKENRSKSTAYKFDEIELGLNCNTLASIDSNKLEIRFWFLNGFNNHKQVLVIPSIGRYKNYTYNGELNENGKYSIDSITMKSYLIDSTLYQRLFKIVSDTNSLITKTDFIYRNDDRCKCTIDIYSGRSYTRFTLPYYNDANYYSNEQQKTLFKFLKERFNYPDDYVMPY